MSLISHFIFISLPVVLTALRDVTAFIMFVMVVRVAPGTPWVPIGISTQVVVTCNYNLCYQACCFSFNMKYHFTFQDAHP